MLSFSFNHRNKSECGIVPKSYIHILDCVLTPKNEYVVKRSAIVDEITTVLCEWGDLFKKFYLTNHEILQPIRHKILELIGLRSQILSGNLPVDEMKKVKLMATSEIDTGNKILGERFKGTRTNPIDPIFAIPSLPPLTLCVSHVHTFLITFFLLYHLVVNKIECRPRHGCTRRKWKHFGYNENINDPAVRTSHLCHRSNTKSNGKRRWATANGHLMENMVFISWRILFLLQNNLNKNRLSKTTNKHSHNLLVTVHAFVCKHQEDSDLLLTLYDGDEMKAITENYVVKWGRQGLARDLDQFDNHRVLFTVRHTIHFTSIAVCELNFFFLGIK